MALGTCAVMLAPANARLCELGLALVSDTLVSAYADQASFLDYSNSTPRALSATFRSITDSIEKLITFLNKLQTYFFHK